MKSTTFQSRENATIRLKPDLKKEIQIQAIREGRSASDVVEDAVILYLQSKK